jgi:hypothetical protein
MGVARIQSHYKPSLGGRWKSRLHDYLLGQELADPLDVEEAVA